MPTAPISTPRQAGRRPGPRCAAGLLLVALCGVAAAGEQPGAGAQAAGRAAPIRVELRPEVEVAGGTVLLGDVAVVSGDDSARVARVRRLEIGRAPLAGRPLRLGREGLSRWVRRRMGLAGARIDWQGAARCQVRLAVQRVAGSALLQRAVEDVEAALSAQGLRAEVRAAGTPRDLDVPVGALELRSRPLPADAAVARRLTAWTEVLVAGREVRAAPVRLELRVHGPAHVAREGQPAGARVDPERLELRDIEWTGRVAPPLPLAGLQGLRLRRPLAKGEPVTRALIEAAPLVARGQRATLHASQGLVRLEGRVEVLQDGFSGQTVPVRLPGASGAIAARVVGPGTVEVTQ